VGRGLGGVWSLLYCRTGKDQQPSQGTCKGVSSWVVTANPSFKQKIITIRVGGLQEVELLANQFTLPGPQLIIGALLRGFWGASGSPLSSKTSQQPRGLGVAPLEGL
jgi:hypothetical protein